MKTTRARRLRRAVLFAVSALSVAARAGEHRRRQPGLVNARDGAPLSVRPAEPPFPATLNADQQALAASMRTAWTSFAASGNPSSRALPWPSLGNGAKVLSLVPLQSKVETDFAAAHHCSFWAGG